MSGVSVQSNREEIASLKQQLFTASEEDKVFIYEDLYNRYLRMRLLLEAEKVGFDHIALLRKNTPKGKLVLAELKLVRLLIDNGKMHQGLEHLEYATGLCHINESADKEDYLQSLMGIYLSLTRRDEKYRTTYNNYLGQYEKEITPVGALQTLDYYMVIASAAFSGGNREKGLAYLARYDALLTKSNELSDAYKKRYNSYRQQMMLGELRTDPDPQKLIEYARSILEKNSREKFLPSTSVFFWLRDLANAYEKAGDVENLKKVFDDLFFSINDYVEENVDNKIYEQKYQSDYYLQQQKLKDADALNKIKDSVFSYFNHELRTPLNIILSNTELVMRTGALPATSLNRLTAIQNQSYNLLNIIDQFIEVNKTNLHFNQVNKEVGDLVQFLQIMATDFTGLCEQKNITLKLQIAGDKKFICQLDFGKLERILYNLLTNAIKFTATNGQVTLQLKLNKKGHQVSFVVTDTGVGIPEHRKETIFEQFYTAQNSFDNIKTSGGFGIGLYLVKQLVVLMKGNISVESHLAKGSVFTVTVPYSDYNGKAKHTSITRRLNYKATNLALQPEVATINTGADKAGKPLLLIVEDSTELLEVISASLLHSYNIKTAGDGEEACEILKSTLPDLVITDLMMPRMNGIALTTFIKNDTALNHIPVIMLTAKGSLPNRIKGWQAGIDMFLRKPFSIAELEHCVQNMIRTNMRAQKNIELIITNTTGKKAKAESPAEKFVRDFKNYVLANIMENDLHNSTIAKHLSMDEHSMYRKIKKLTGYTPVQLVTRLKIMQAKKFMDEGHFNTLKEVAYNSGFNDPKYFSRVYKKEMGALPLLKKK